MCAPANPMRSLAIVFALISGSLTACVDDVYDSNDIGDPGGKGDGDNQPNDDLPTPPPNTDCNTTNGSQKPGPGVCVPHSVNTLTPLNAVPRR